MQIRDYQPADSQAIAELFYHTVHTVNAADYSQPQLEAWAPAGLDAEQWCRRFAVTHTLVADYAGNIVGFANIDASSHLDCLYVHRDYQRQGIATRLVDEIEQYAVMNQFAEITVDVSITAKPFFSRRGYAVMKENVVMLRGEKLINYTMKKSFVNY